MKILLDENDTKHLKKDLSDDHEVFTVRDMLWEAFSNGDLLRKMLEEECEVLITFDGSLSKQQNFNKYPIPVIVLSAYRSYYARLQPLIPYLKAILNTNLPIRPTIVSEKDIIL
ncbi:MAG: hypothetical protein HC817_09855 [Saprospiraceae bacterium]|nr:hypothetical protein [Saprospiraceae bacterium]